MAKAQADSQAPAPVPIVLCADDYGLAPGVSSAIRQLIEAGRLSATGCMAASRFWVVEAPPLAALGERADLGLHFTLTGMAPLGPMARLAPGGIFPGLGVLTRLAYSRALDQGEIGAELDRQIAAFAAAIGRPPDFIDGHQHVHQLPVVRGAVLARARAHGAYLRYATEPLWAVLGRGIAVARSAAIALMGRSLAREGRQAGIPGSSSFRGVRDFAPSEDYARLFPRFLARPARAMIVACHPGRVDEALIAADPVTVAREDEFSYFASPRFAADLAAAGVRLARFRDC